MLARFDPAPFHAGKGNEVWANFEFVNIDENDRDMLAFAIKADKPGRKDRFRVDHDIGCGHSGNEPAMSAMISPPTEGDYGYYFLDRGMLKTDELLHRNPGAAIKINRFQPRTRSSGLRRDSGAKMEARGLKMAKRKEALTSDRWHEGGARRLWTIATI